MPFDPKLDIGYVGSGVQILDPDGNVQSVGDTKEQFMMTMTNNQLISDCKATTDPDNVFDGNKNYSPAVQDHATVTKEYTAAAYQLNLNLNALLFDALQVDMADCDTLGSEPFLVLKQMRYAGEISDQATGKFGAGARADWGSFTILATDQTPGLQLQMGNDNWLPVPPLQDCLIVNSGDQIAQLTNYTYRSAVHRVVTVSNKPRFSTAFFTYFGMHATVAPLDKFVSSSDEDDDDDDLPAARYPYGRTHQ